MGTGLSGGVRAGAWRWLNRSAPSKSRALRKLPDGNFRRGLVGSLRACSSAEMAALGCIAAARIGFLLAALHSVAERVNPRKARPPAPHCPRVLASAAVPITAAEGKSRETRCGWLEPRGPKLAIFPTALGHMPRSLQNGNGAADRGGGGV